MMKGLFGFRGGEKKDTTLVDSWEQNSSGKTIIYTTRTVPSKMAYIYDCQIVEKMQARSANETIIGGEQLSRAAVEKLPKFVKLLTGSLPL